MKATEAVQKTRALFGRFDRPKWSPAMFKDDQDDARGLIGWLLTVFFVTAPIVFIWEFFWPDVIPYTLGEFWIWNPQTVLTGIGIVWPIYVWGAVLTSIGVLWRGAHIFGDIDDAEDDLLIGGAIRSTIAGVCEEIMFRYFIFFGAIIGVQIADWIFGGFLFGAGLPYLFYNLIGWWTTNLSAFWCLGWLVDNPEVPWFIAAAAISTNVKFRIEHAYQGFIGWYNSWLGGWVLFWVFFNYGLIAAIAVHFLYDMIIFFTLYVWAKLHGFK